MQSKTKSAKIAAQLEQMILNKEFESGELLPSQQKLAVQFNTSPRSIREALNSLEVKGLVTIVQGKRTLVNETSLDKFIESLSSSLLNDTPLDKKLLMDLMQVRTTIEVSAARELSRREDRKKIAEKMKKVLDKMNYLVEDIQDVAYNHKLTQLDEEFHQLIIKSNNNQILSSIQESLEPLLQRYLKLIEYTIEERKKLQDRYAYLIEGFINGTTDLTVALTLVILNDTKNKCEMLSI